MHAVISERIRWVSQPQGYLKGFSTDFTNTGQFSTSIQSIIAQVDGWLTYFVVHPCENKIYPILFFFV